MISCNTAFLLLCALGLLSCFTIEAAPTYLYHICADTTTFKPNSTYHNNLNSLLSSLSSNATHDSGFYNATAGRTPDLVYGLFLCRGDVTAKDCQDCVVNATAELQQQCSGVKEAVIWYDQCMLRYSNRFIFSRVEDVPMVAAHSVDSMTDTGRLHLQEDTMNATATQAANDESGKRFATKEVKLTGSQTLYTLAQCTPDLSIADCNTCLAAAVQGLSSCCSGKQGARTLCASCNVRYEVYPFYQLTTASMAPAPAPASAPALTPATKLLPPPAPNSTSRATGKGSFLSQVIIDILVPTISAVMILER